MPPVHLDDMLRHARSEGYAVGAYGAVDSTFVSAIADEVERTCRVFGAAGRGEAVLGACLSR